MRTRSKVRAAKRTLRPIRRVRKATKKVRPSKLMRKIPEAKIFMRHKRNVRTSHKFFEAQPSNAYITLK